MNATGSIRAGRRSLLLAAFAILIADFAFAGGNFAIRNGTVAGGGHIVAQGNFRLTGTVAEPVQGTTAQGPYRITSGFPATIGNINQGGPGDGRIFADGFED
jgi:hypothetical protein